MKFSVLFLSFSILLSSGIFAAKEYGDVSMGKVAAPAPPPSRTITQDGSSFFKHYTFDVKLENKTVNKKNEKENLASTSFSVETPYEAYIDLHHLAQVKKGKSVAGKVTFGLHWLTTASTNSIIGLDFYGAHFFPTIKEKGYSSKSENSIGLETSKNLGRFLFAFNAEASFLDNPSVTDEAFVEKIYKVGGGIGLVISQDIRFSMEVNNFKLMGIKSQDSPSSSSYLSISPKLSLLILPRTNLHLGLTIPTGNNLSDETKEKLAFSHLDGFYGRSINIGTNITF